MDINPQSAKPISDDQELAKVLAGVTQQTDQPLQFDTPTPAVPPAPAPSTTTAAEDTTAPTTEATPLTTPAESTESNEPPAEKDEPVRGYNPPTPTEDPALPAPSAPASPTNDLSDIKKDALSDLRPLVDKLEIAPEEKFDTYLLLIRSTDDKTLIAPAYAAAQAIVDEPRKAQALLDVIKEIDYLSKPQ